LALGAGHETTWQGPFLSTILEPAPLIGIDLVLIGEASMETPEHEARHVREYFESQTPEDDDEVVKHVEKVASERVMGHDYDVFDVHTNKGRWWVITNPTNLYSHEDHPSLDHALSFHLGLMLRVMERERHDDASDEERDRFARTWRRFDSAVYAFNRAQEAEDFQNVAAQCRQCLISFAHELEPRRFLRSTDVEPRRDDFKGWTDVVACEIAHGQRVRSYLKSISHETWNLVAWLVHFEDAIAYDAELVLDATANTLHSFGLALLRHETRQPDRCPECDSYRIVTDFRPELDDPPYVILCAACGWEIKAQPWCEEGKVRARAEGIEPVEDDFGPPPHINRGTGAL